MEWTPQQYVKGALIASGVGVLACLGIIMVAIRRRRLPVDRDGEDEVDGSAADLDASAAPVIVEATFASFRSNAAPAGWGRAIVVALALGLGTTVLTRTMLGVAVALCVLAVLRWPQARIALRLLPAAMMVLVGAYVAWGQLRHNYTANFEWPTYFESARNISWLVVIFLAADVVVGRVLKRNDATLLD